VYWHAQDVSCVVSLNTCLIGTDETGDKTCRLDVQSVASASAVCHPSGRGGYSSRRRAVTGCARLCRITCIDMKTFTANLYPRGADEVCQGFDCAGLVLVLVTVQVGGA
jgi:hypothetical protein